MSSLDGVWACVVNWNGGAANLRALRSLVDEGVAEQRIVFVDNASTDGSPEEVRAAFPGVVWRRNETNVGYGDGTNQGLELALAAGARELLMVNNDLVFEPGCLAALLRELEDEPRVGVVGPRVLYAAERDTIWAAGGRMTWRQNLSTLIGHRRPDGARYRATADVDYVPGCALLVRREVLERVGLLEGDYFAYHEDVEFCQKVREAGWKVRCVGAVAAYHEAHLATGGGYNPRRKYLMGVNTVRFLRRHGTPGRWLSFLVFDVLSLPFAWLLRAPRGEGAGVLAKARGMWDGLRGRRAGP